MLSGYPTRSTACRHRPTGPTDRGRLPHTATRDTADYPLPGPRTPPQGIPIDPIYLLPNYYFVTFSAHICQFASFFCFQTSIWTIFYRLTTKNWFQTLLLPLRTHKLTFRSNFFAFRTSKWVHNAFCMLFDAKNGSPELKIAIRTQKIAQTT